MRQPEGRTAVVTGAAGGIGLAIVQAFVAEGMHVVMADMDEQRLGASATRLRDEGADVHAVTVDVRDPGARAYVFTDDHSTGDVEARLRAILAARADVLG
jgi:NADP-dependent 3-hydroxy acid dehydrogenase YdfG